MQVCFLKEVGGSLASFGEVVKAPKVTWNPWLWMVSSSWLLDFLAAAYIK